MSFVDGLDFAGDAAAVFVGEVVSERSGSDNAFGEQELELVFRVDRLYRGDLTDRALVYSIRDNGANCGLNPDGVMAVRAYVGDDQRLRTDGCSAMRVVEGGEVEAALLDRFGPGIVPPPADPEITLDDGFGEDSGPPWILVGGAAFAIALAAGSVLILRTEKSTG